MSKKRPTAESRLTLEEALTLGFVVSVREVRGADEKFYEERDRRYAEVNIEREKALKIKETADLAALSLAREIQDYKDEKANNLREQITGERGHYATKEDLKALGEKFEAAIAPLSVFVAGTRGRTVGSELVTKFAFAAIAAAGVIFGIAQSLNH